MSKFFTDPPEIITILHDSNNSYRVFFHSLRLAIALKGTLEIFDIRKDYEAIEHIGVRTLMETWGFLQANSSHADVVAKGLKVAKRFGSGKKSEELQKRFSRKSYDMAIFGENADAVFPWNRNRYLKIMLDKNLSILHIPPDCIDFVDETTGKFTVRSILFPIFYDEQYRLVEEAGKFFGELFSEASPELCAFDINKDNNSTASISWNRQSSLSFEKSLLKSEMVIVATKFEQCSERMRKNVLNLIGTINKSVLFFLVN